MSKAKKEGTGREEGGRKRGRKNGAGVKGDLREGTCFAIERVSPPPPSSSSLSGLLEM